MIIVVSNVIVHVKNTHFEIVNINHKIGLIFAYTNLYQGSISWKDYNILNSGLFYNIGLLFLSQT